MLTEAYSDRTLVLITQTGKVGSLTQVTLPLASLEQTFEVSPGLGDDGPILPVPYTSLQLTPLLSSTPPEFKTLYDVYLNQVAMIVLTGFTPESPTPSRPRNPDRMSKPVIIGLALTRATDPLGEEEVMMERTRFQAIMSMVIECRVW